MGKFNLPFGISVAKKGENCAHNFLKFYGVPFTKVFEVYISYGHDLAQFLDIYKIVQWQSGRLLLYVLSKF